MNRSRQIWLLLLGFALLVACRERPPADERPGLTVAVSIVPQRWLVEQIGGGDIEVITLIEPGKSPATYQPTDRQISRLRRAAVYFRIGVPFENAPWFDAVMASSRMHLVDTRRGIALRTMQSHAQAGKATAEEHPHTGAMDPHLWLCPRLLKKQAQIIAEVLCELDPAHEADYSARLLRLDKRLDEVEAAIREKLTPLKDRAFLVFHPAWGYFADEFDLRQIAIEIGGKQPTDRELTELLLQARAEGIRVVFVQPQIAGNAAEAVAEAISGRVETLDPLAPDVAENLLRVADAIAESFSRP